MVPLQVVQNASGFTHAAGADDDGGIVRSGQRLGIIPVRDVAQVVELKR